MGNAKKKKSINGVKLQVLNARDGVLLSAWMTKFCALHTLTLVMVVQQKKFAGKPSKTKMENSALEKNSPSDTNRKITGIPVKDEVDTFQLLITAQYIARNGWEKFNAQYMKMF